VRFRTHPDVVLSGAPAVLILDSEFEARDRQLGDRLNAIVIVNYALWLRYRRIDDLVGCALPLSQAIHLDREQRRNRQHRTHCERCDHLRQADHHL
jgi:hypothetical protein